MKVLGLCYLRFKSMCWLTRSFFSFFDHAKRTIISMFDPYCIFMNNYYASDPCYAFAKTQLVVCQFSSFYDFLELLIEKKKRFLLS